MALPLVLCGLGFTESGLVRAAVVRMMCCTGGVYCIPQWQDGGGGTMLQRAWVHCASSAANHLTENSHTSGAH
eukprot:4906761-Amphidinium_carterae.1